MIAPWEEPWARLLAFREHLPEHYEISATLVRTYHNLTSELESTTGIVLKNFQIPPDEIRPKVVSAIPARMRRPGRVNYSTDDYCLRSNILMRLDGLIRFLTPRLESVVSHQPGIVSGRLLPHEELALALYRFTESSGKSQWRPTSLGDLHNLTRTDHGQKRVSLSCRKR